MARSASIVDPPAIVAQADLTEEQIVQEIVKADVDHFAIGRLILQMKRQAGGQITDQDIADRINARHPDRSATSAWVRDHRVVAETFNERSFALPWYHHLVTAVYDRQRAAEWLAQAAQYKWSAESLRQNILAERGESAGVGRLTFFRRQVRELFPNREMFPTQRAVRKFLKENEDLVIDNHELFADEGQRLIKEGQEILDFLEAHPVGKTATTRKES